MNGLGTIPSSTYRDQIAAKEKEMALLNECRLQEIEEAHDKKQIELDEKTAQLEKLKVDFEYNLTLIHDRDLELARLEPERDQAQQHAERLEQEVAKLKAEKAEREAQQQGEELQKKQQEEARLKVLSEKQEAARALQLELQVVRDAAATTAEQVAELQHKTQLSQVSEAQLKERSAMLEERLRQKTQDFTLAEEKLRAQLSRNEAELQRVEQQSSQAVAGKHAVESELHQLNLKWLDAEQRIARSNFQVEEATRAREQDRKACDAELARKDQAHVEEVQRLQKTVVELEQDVARLKEQARQQNQQCAQELVVKHEEGQRLVNALKEEMSKALSETEQQKDAEVKKVHEDKAMGLAMLSQQHETREAALVQDLDRRIAALQERHFSEQQVLKQQLEEKVRLLEQDLQQQEAQRKLDEHRHALELETERNETRRKASEVTSLSEKIAALESRTIPSLRQGGEIATLEVQALKEQLEAARKELETRRSDQERMQRQYQLSGTRREIALEQELARSKQNLYEAERERDRQMEQAAELERQNTHCRSLLAAPMRDSLGQDGGTYAQAAAAAQREDLRRVKALLEDRDARCRALEAQLRSVELELQDCKHDASSSELRLLRERYRVLEDEAARLRADKFDLEREVQSLKAERSRWQDLTFRHEEHRKEVLPREAGLSDRRGLSELAHTELRSELPRREEWSRPELTPQYPPRRDPPARGLDSAGWMLSARDKLQQAQRELDFAGSELRTGRSPRPAADRRDSDLTRAADKLRAIAHRRHTDRHR